MTGPEACPVCGQPDSTGECSHVRLSVEDWNLLGEDPADWPDPRQVTVTVTRSSGPDGAVLVFVDATFEPNGSDGGPGLRVLVNDGPGFTGVSYVSPGDDLREAPDRTLTVPLSEIDYRERKGT